MAANVRDRRETNTLTAVIQSHELAHESLICQGDAGSVITFADGLVVAHLATIFVTATACLSPSPHTKNDKELRNAMVSAYGRRTTPSILVLHLSYRHSRRI